MNRRSLICLCSFLAAVIFGGRQLNAEIHGKIPIPVTILGPKTFTRSTGKPTPQTVQFKVPATVQGPFTLAALISNGLEKKKVSSGTISINGVQIAGPSDFHEFDVLVKRIDKLDATNNTLTVDVASAPGAFITLWIGGFAAESTPPPPPPPPSTSTPTLVQAVNTSSTLGNLVNIYTVRLPNVTLSGNAVVLAVQQHSGSGALTVSDDKGNVYNVGKINNDGVQTVSVFYALNAIPGTQTITLSFADPGANYVSAVAAEFYNVATSSALDGVSANGDTNTLITAGNLTTTADHDLIFQYATQDTDGMNTSWTQGSAPWALLAADYFDAQAAQYQVQAAFGTVSPAFTQNSSKRFNSVAIALKAASAGTAPTGMRVVHLAHNHVPQSPGSSLPLQFPSSGNLIVVSWIAVPGCNITSVFDGNSNTYTSTGPAFGNGGSGDNQMYYAGSAVTSTDLKGLTLNVAGTGCEGGTDNALLYDISGAAASPFDAAAGRATASGQQDLPGDLTTVTITPSTPGGIIITQTGVTYFTLVSLTPGNFVASVPTPDIISNAVDNNNGWGFSYYSDTSPKTFVYGTINGAVYQWASIAVAFKK